jgi:hypothetical protein
MRRPARSKRPKPKRDDAALIGRLSGALPLASAQSAAVAARWLASLKSKAAGTALKKLIAEHPRA